MSVARAQSEISAREFTEWIAMQSIEPYGVERNELAISMAATAICNSLGAKMKAGDLMPRFDEHAEQMSGDDVARFFEDNVFARVNEAFQ